MPGLTLWRRGKVRDVYDLGDRLLIVATDRISAFDVVLPSGIPAKGIVLTQLSLFWFHLLGDLLPNHVITANVAEYGPELARHREQLEGRSMIVLKTDPLPVECVVRGYITGSGWKDYRATGAVCGIPLPAGLQESQRLDPALFTPSTKAETGHDENISLAQVERVLGGAHPGAIVDLHDAEGVRDAPERLLAALPPMIAGLRELGYEFTTVGELLETAGAGGTR